ncbi:MAG: hypothetical protein Q9P14_08810 [candidate division KSB1 bacterium]|nr:hypothetical protein [candidate division KSB1 bacterium]
MIRRQQVSFVDPFGLEAACEYVRGALGESPEVAIILGSGLGHFTEAMQAVRSLSTRDIPHYPVSTVMGHKGQWVIGKIASVPNTKQ